MSQGLKETFKKNGCNDHVVEFGNCIGIVQGYTNYGNVVGPDVDVRWQPSNLRYAYDPKYLIIV